MRELDHVRSERGGTVGPPPLILGHRGTPRLAPENTLVSLRRALELGLDGVEYDLQAARGGDPVLLHDDTLTRTTDGHGPVEEADLTELAGLDAGAWFGKAFTGEPLPLLEEALELDTWPEAGPPGAGGAPLHMIELKRRDLVARVASALEGLPRPLPVRIASFHRNVCTEAMDHGLPAMLLAVRANAGDREFVRHERIAAYGVAAFGWRTPAGRGVWPCERWSWSVDAPADLLEACRTPLYGFNTNEPLRALSVRALTRLAPGDDGPYPLEVPELEVFPGTFSSHSFASGGGEWTGRWSFEVHVRNPFDHPVEVELGFAARRGAFEIEGGPTELALEPGERRPIALELAGGSWSPGLDPCLMARLAWSAGAGREPGALVLDAPLARVRRVVARDVATRLDCLHESPGGRPASLAMRRRGRELLCEVENPGGLEQVSIQVHLDGETFLGTRGLRLLLPEDFDRRPSGVAFSAALVGFDPERDVHRPVMRRWAGGLPPGGLAGSPGRLLPRPA